jgi:hypothetical protein
MMAQVAPITTPEIKKGKNNEKKKKKNKGKWVLLTRVTVADRCHGTSNQR